MHAMAFVNAVAELAEQQNHHPDITINYCTVSLHITTHDAGMLTDKDYTLAEAISLLVTN
jgi:4a-hydroxytetrahydrobiopterin dehydratase